VLKEGIKNLVKKPKDSDSHQKSSVKKKKKKRQSRNMLLKKKGEMVKFEKEINS